MSCTLHARLVHVKVTCAAAGCVGFGGGGGGRVFFASLGGLKDGFLGAMFVSPLWRFDSHRIVKDWIIITGNDIGCSLTSQLFSLGRIQAIG